MRTIADQLALAGAALDALAAVADEIVEETQYVTDLVGVYRARFAAVTEARGAQPADAAVERAVALVVEEAGLVTDPHRAIDWISTLPQVVLLAIGEGA